MTFNDLVDGDRFVFLYNDPDRVDVQHRVKTGPNSFDLIGADGSVVPGRVGCGDNPVRRIKTCIADDGKG